MYNLYGPFNIYINNNCSDIKKSTSKPNITSKPIKPNIFPIKPEILPTSNCRSQCNSKKCGGINGCNNYCNIKFINKNYNFNDPTNSTKLIWKLQNKYNSNFFTYDTLIPLGIVTETPSSDLPVTLNPVYNNFNELPKSKYILKSNNSGPDLVFEADDSGLFFEVLQDIQMGDNIKIEANTHFLISVRNNDYLYVNDTGIRLVPITCNNNCLTFINDDQNCGYCGNKCAKNEKCCGQKCINLKASETCGEHDCYKICQDGYINCAGNCVSTNLYNANCVCKNGNTGDNCDQIPCSGRGKLNLAGKCECENQYSGNNCEIVCSGHGNLTDGPNNTKICQCTGGWNGNNCATCLANFDETCTKCIDYYYGDKCQNNCLKNTQIFYNYNNQTSYSLQIYDKNCCAISLQRLLTEPNLFTPIPDLQSLVNTYKLNESSLLILLVGNLTLNTTYSNLVKINEKTFYVLNSNNKSIGPFDISIVNNDTNQTITYSKITRPLFQGECRDISVNPFVPNWVCQTLYGSVQFYENDSQNYKKMSVPMRGSSNNLPEILIIGPEFSQDQRCGNTCRHGRCLYQSTCPPNYDQTDPNCQKCANNWTGENCDICPPNFNENNNCQGCINFWSGTNCDQCPNYVNNQNNNCDELIPTILPTCPPNFDISDGTCTKCAAGYKGVNCQFSDLVTCSGNGIVDVQGNCICKNKWLFSGKERGNNQCNYCEIKYDNSNGQCDGSKCAQGYTGPDCIYDSSTCYGKGVPDYNGKCTCTGPWTGEHCDVPCTGDYYMTPNNLCCKRLEFNNYSMWIDNTGKIWQFYIPTSGSPYLYQKDTSTYLFIGYNTISGGFWQISRIGSTSDYNGPILSSYNNVIAGDLIYYDSKTSSYTFKNTKNESRNLYLTPYGSTCDGKNTLLK